MSRQQRAPNPNIVKFKQSRWWVGRQVFTSADVASYLKLSRVRAQQILLEMKDEIDRVRVKKSFHYQRKAGTNWLRIKWV